MSTGEEEYKRLNPEDKLWVEARKMVDNGRRRVTLFRDRTDELCAEEKVLHRASDYE